MRLTLQLLLMLLAVLTSEAANVHIRWHTGGTRDGTTWDTAYTNIAGATYNRGDTLYLADTDGITGFPSVTFNKAVSGGTVITVKKATDSDHGASDWQSSYGDGVCIILDRIVVTTHNWVIDGNGTHTVPSNDPADYFLRLSANTSSENGGLFAVGSSANPVTNVTVRYLQITNTFNSDDNASTVMYRAFPGEQNSHNKIQNCWFQNCGKEGLQWSDTSFVLVERNWFARMGKKTPGTPDNHGQTVQMFSSNYPIHDFVYRYNVWDRCEGQSLIAYVDDGNASANSLTRFRFYGNVVMNPYNTVDTEGFNTSGGIIGNAWDGQGITNLAVYGNTIVNIRNTYTTTAATSTHFPIHAGTSVNGAYRHNNLFFNCESSSATSFTSDSHNASGGLGTAGGTSEQTGLSSSIFTDYQGNNFHLASTTSAPKDLTAESWWDDGADGFFGALDSINDWDGNSLAAVRGALAVSQAGDIPAVSTERPLPLKLSR